MARSDGLLHYLKESSLRSMRLSTRNISRCPPLYPRIADRALPSAVFGPVDFSHGRQRRINSARNARCSGVR